LHCSIHNHHQYKESRRSQDKVLISQHLLWKKQYCHDRLKIKTGMKIFHRMPDQQSGKADQLLNLYFFG
jgi:hypothetical protein